MVKVAEFSSPIAGMGMAGMIGPVLPPRISVHGCAQAAAASAQEQGLAGSQIELEGMYALLGLTEDRRVLGLECRAGRWALARVPIPTALVARLPLPSAFSPGFKPLWVRLLPGSLAIFRDGKEMAVWDARSENPLVPDMGL